MSQPPPGERPDADARDTAQTSTSAGDSTTRIVKSEDLLGGRSQLAIRHNDAIYVLRQTKLGKLILTK